MLLFSSLVQTRIEGPSMTDLEIKIVSLLRTEGTACPPSLLAFKMPEHSFSEITAAIRALGSRGVLRIESRGVELIGKLPASEGEASNPEPGSSEGRANTEAANDVHSGTESGPRNANIIPEPVSRPPVSHSVEFGAPIEDRIPSTNGKAPIAIHASKEFGSRREPLFAGMTDKDIDSFFDSLQWGANVEQANHASNPEDEYNEDRLDAKPAASSEQEDGAVDSSPLHPLRYDDALGALELSARPNGALAANGIQTLLDLARYKSLDRIRNLGQLSIKEIAERLEEHAVPIEKEELENLTSWCNSEDLACEFIFDQFGVLRSTGNSSEVHRRRGRCPSSLRELSIKTIGLSGSTAHVLEEHGVRTLGKLCTYSKTDLATLFPLSRRQVSEVVEALRHFEAHLASGDDWVFPETGFLIGAPAQVSALNPSARMATELLATRHVPVYEPMSSLWLNRELSGVETNLREVEAHLNALLDELAPSIQTACEVLIAQWAMECTAKMEGGFAEPQTQAIPSDAWWQKAAEATSEEIAELQYLADKSELQFSPPSLHDWLGSLPNGQAVTAVKRRLSGLTLEQVGCELGVTRERVRQLQSNLLKKAPVLREDLFVPLFEKYKLDQDLFCQITGCGPEVYRYLEFRYRRNRHQTLHIAAAQEDVSVPENVRTVIGAYLISESHKGMVKMEEGYVRADRKSTVLYAMKRLASSGAELTDIDTLYTELTRLVRDHGFPRDVLSSGNRGLYSWIQRTACIMAPAQRHLRLHDFGAYEYDDLRDCLEVMSEQNVECSSQLVFEAYPDVMRALDIRDCNELHFTIKTQLGDSCPGVYSLGRNPMMTLGTADRKAQIRGLIEEMTPVSRNDLAEEYSRRYRVSEASFLASFLGDFQQYRSGNIYSIRSADFTEEERSYLLSILDDCDYFPLSLARQQFKGTFPASKAIICDESLRPMGYAISQSLVVKDGVDLRQAFAKAIDGLDKFGEGDDGFFPDVFAHSLFSSELNVRLRNLSLVECGPRHYVKTRYLTDVYDVTEDDIRQFIHVVSNSIQPGDPFTVQRLRCLGLSHKVDNALVTGEFDDGLLQGMLSAGPTVTGFRTSSIGSTTLFCSGVTSIDAPRYMEGVIRREGPLTLEDLLDILERDDGITTTASVLRQIIQRSTLFCVPSLDEMIFASERAYNDYVNDLLG